ncbi:hypothetical protein ACHAXT_010663 [Thalassiosira profunda]
MWKGPKCGFGFRLGTKRYISRADRPQFFLQAASEEATQPTNQTMKVQSALALLLSVAPSVSAQGKSKNTPAALKRNDANKFKAPGEGDRRGPCPVINTLANHGFIARDGVTGVNDLVDALETVFRVSRDTLRNGSVGSAARLGLLVNCTEEEEEDPTFQCPCDDVENLCLSIDQLGQNRYNRGNNLFEDEAQEHDASHFREDSVGPDDVGLERSPVLVDAFFDAQSAPGTLDIEEVMAYQRDRIQEGCKARNPARVWTPGHRGGAATQGVMLFVIAQAGQGRPQKEQSNLRTIVDKQRLPADYNPNPDVLIKFTNGVCSSDALRDAFRANVDYALCNFEECEEAAANITCGEVVEPCSYVAPLDPFDC